MILRFSFACLAAWLSAALATHAQHAPSSLTAGRLLTQSSWLEETGGYSYQSDMIFAVTGPTTMEFSTAPGTYTYTKTGQNTATLAFNISDPGGSWNAVHLMTFTSPTSGTYTSTGNYTIPDYGSFPFTETGTFGYLLPVPATLAPVADNFDDNAKDPSKWGDDISTMATPGTLAESNGRLQFITGVKGEHDAYRPWVRTGNATYDKDWEMTVDISNTITLPSSGFATAGMGIAIVSPHSIENHHQIELTRWTDDGVSGYSIAGSWAGGGMEYPEAGSTASFRIIYRAAEKQIVSFFDINGPTGGYVWEPFSTSSVAGWGMTGSESFRIAVFGNADNQIVTAGTLYADNFRITPEPEMTTWKRRHFGDPETTNAADLHDPDFDGIPNLIEYASGLDPWEAIPTVIAPGSGTRGLPHISVTGAKGSEKLRLEYVRRTASSLPGIVYQPQFSDNLLQAGAGSWQAATGSQAITPIDASWERVVIEDTVAGAGKRFGRVKVTKE